jgi:hypothetical protein
MESLGFFFPRKERSKKMERNRYISQAMLALVLAFSFSGCGGAYWGNLNSLNKNKENELRQTWNNYNVFKKGRSSFISALVYKIKNDKKIVMDRYWVVVTTEDEMAKIKFMDFTHSAEILGQNKELYGYLVYRYKDLASVKIIDAQTVQLFYHYTREGGP